MFFFRKIYLVYTIFESNYYVIRQFKIRNQKLSSQPRNFSVQWLHNVTYNLF